MTTQKSFVALDEHDSGSRPDLIMEVHQAAEDAELGSSIEVVMVESKIGSIEGEDQLKRYAEHLSDMAGTRRTLAYITRAYDPKDDTEITSGLDNVQFKQLRWYDFYRFLQAVETDALSEEVMAFMEEQGMARSYRFSTADLMALSGVPRAFEIFDETLGGEVKAELESVAGNKVRRESVGLNLIRNIGRYIISIYLDGGQGHFYAGYKMRTPDGYPVAYVGLEAWQGATDKEMWVAAMKRIALREGWETVKAGKVTIWTAPQLGMGSHVR